MGLSARCASLNNQQMIEKEQWPVNSPKNKYHGVIISGARRANLFWNLHPKLKTVSESKVAL